MMKFKTANNCHKLTTVFSVLMIFLAGCSSTQTLQDPATGATLWVQNAAEYDALTLETYQTAEQKLDEVMQDSSHTAALEQQKQDFKNLPPAIILDVDETVLNNSPFQARLIKQHAHYTPDKWSAWVREAQADAITGAVALTQKAAQKGITVFYVTNRDASLEKATRKNLKKRGFPLKENTDVLLLKNEHSNWTSAKVNRRKFIAQKYHIIMLFGDNLNDLLPADNITNEQRKALVKKHQNQFGYRWFIFPNPTYGSWQQALYDFNDSLTPAQIKQQRKRMLHTKN